MVAHPIQTLEGLADGMTPTGNAKFAMNLAITVAERANAIQNGNGFESTTAVTETFLDVASIIAGSKGLGSTLKGEAAIAKAPIAVTEESIASALEGSTMKTTQGSVSLPVVERYVRQLEAGSPAPAVKVNNGVLVDGNHRFVAGRVFGTEPKNVPGTMSPSQVPFIKPVRELKIDLFDWGNK